MIRPTLPPDPPAAAAQPPAARVPWLRIAVAGGLPLVVTLALYLPALKPRVQMLEGRADAAEACIGPLCAQVLRVQPAGAAAGPGKLLACRADLLGVPYDCRAAWLEPGPVRARWAALPSLAGVLGLAPTAGVLVELERDGRRVFRRPVDQQVWQALYGGWVFHALYWPAVALAWWLWPTTGLGRRLIRHASWNHPPPAPDSGPPSAPPR